MPEPPAAVAIAEFWKDPILPQIDGRAGPDNCLILILVYSPRRRLISPRLGCLFLFASLSPGRVR